MGCECVSSGPVAPHCPSAPSAFYQGASAVKLGYFIPDEAKGQIMRTTALLQSSLLTTSLALSLALPLTPALSAQPPAAEPAAQHGTIAIRAGHLLDVESGRVLTDQVILVRDGRIQAVGPNL